MNLILSAIALTIAVPAAAQTAPAMDHSQHSQAEHAQHEAAKGADQHKGHAEKHECPMMKDGKKMACCDKHGDGKAAAKPAGHGAHADHGGH